MTTQEQTSASSGESDAVSKVHEVAEQVRDKAAQGVGSIRQSAESARAEAVQRVRKLGNAVRKIGEHMRIEDQAYIAKHANSASQRLDSVASYIESTELRSMWRDAGAVARKKPALIFGGTFLLGLAAGRFLKTPIEGAVSLPKPKAPQLAAGANDTKPNEANPNEARPSMPGSARSSANTSPGIAGTSTPARRDAGDPGAGARR
jgi:hypothetical protein